jgi:hypothetical protein
MRRLVIAASCALACGSARAETVTLDDAALKGALSGKTVYLDTPLGVGIPITYHGNGLMSGKAGLLEYILGAQTDRGRWWVAEGKLCQKWFKWLDAQPNCMRLRQEGKRIFWRRDDGLSGTATIASALPPEADAPPQGLGGPLQQADLLPPAGDAAEPNEPAARPPPRHAMPTAAARRPARLAHPGGQGASTAVAPEPSFARGQVPMRSVRFLRTGHGDRWCQGEGVAEYDEDAAPNLVQVARANFATSVWQPATTACLAAEPALQVMVRLGLDVP